MINTTFKMHDAKQILETINNAVHLSFENLAQSEPQLVANLVYNLPKQLNQLKLNKGTSIVVGGVFVHARPLIKCTKFPEKSPKSVEIGDLLLIQTHVSGENIIKRNALLLQAKKGLKSKPDNKNQWHIYEKWPLFEYAKRSGHLTGERRIIFEPDMYDAAKYLFIGSSGCGKHSIPGGFDIQHYLRCDDCGLMTAQPTPIELSRYQCFIQELFNFVQGNAGKSFTDPKPEKNGWDQVIHDLILSTKNRVSVFLNRAYNSFDSKIENDRIYLFGTDSKHALFSRISNLESIHNFSAHENDSGPPNINGGWPEEPEHPEDSGGISIIEFIVNTKE